MPPKPKFTREEVIAAALEIVSEKGKQALTSRDLGARLGSSARPLFTVFKNMEELQKEVETAALKRFEEYIKKALDYSPAFKQVGVQMIAFSIEEPKLYQLLFMSENGKAGNFDDVFARLGEMGPICIEIIQKDYDLNKQQAMALFRHVWIHTFGIGALCATGVCRFTKEEMIEMLGHDFLAMLMFTKTGGMQLSTPVPEKEG